MLENLPPSNDESTIYFECISLVQVFQCPSDVQLPMNKLVHWSSSNNNPNDRSKVTPRRTIDLCRPVSDRRVHLILEYMFCTRIIFLYHDATIQCADPHVKPSEIFTTSRMCEWNSVEGRTSPSSSTIRRRTPWAAGC